MCLKYDLPGRPDHRGLSQKKYVFVHIFKNTLRITLKFSGHVHKLWHKLYFQLDLPRRWTHASWLEWKMEHILQIAVVSMVVPHPLHKYILRKAAWVIICLIISILCPGKINPYDLYLGDEGGYRDFGQILVPAFSKKAWLDLMQCTGFLSLNTSTLFFLSWVDIRQTLHPIMDFILR